MDRSINIFIVPKMTLHGNDLLLYFPGDVTGVSREESITPCMRFAQAKINVRAARDPAGDALRRIGDYATTRKAEWVRVPHGQVKGKESRLPLPTGRKVGNPVAPEARWRLFADGF